MKYALIRNNKIAKFKNVPIDDALLIDKLLAHGYLLVEEQALSICDLCTQTLIDEYEIHADRVLRVWTIQERPFEDARTMKEEIIGSKALDDIREIFGEPDEELKVASILAAKNKEIAKMQTAKTNQDLRTMEVK